MSCGGPASHSSYTDPGDCPALNKLNSKPDILYYSPDHSSTETWMSSSSTGRSFCVAFTAQHFSGGPARGTCKPAKRHSNAPASPGGETPSQGLHYWALHGTGMRVYTYAAIYTQMEVFQFCGGVWKTTRGFGLCSLLIQAVGRRTGANMESKKSCMEYNLTSPINRSLAQCFQLRLLTSTKFLSEGHC